MPLRELGLGDEVGAAGPTGQGAAWLRAEKGRGTALSQAHSLLVFPRFIYYGVFLSILGVDNLASTSRNACQTRDNVQQDPHMAS